jgi:hypothetical protein
MTGGPTSGGTTAPVAARPGRTYFVPGVRIVKLGKLAPGPEAGVELTEAQPDILAVEVTLVNHGSGHYCIRLSNWFDTLPADRREIQGPRMANEVMIGNVPAWPRFKYDDFSIFQFGERLRIDMRYWPDPADGLDPVVAASHRWVPMISGPISDIRFFFTEKEGNYVEVCGEDDLCPLKDKNPDKKDYWAIPEREIIEDTVGRSKYPLPVRIGPTALPKFAEQEAKALAEAHFEGTSYLDYLKKFAERLDCEVFVEFADLNEPRSGVVLHFERSRSRLPPDGTLRDIYGIVRGKNLHTFAPDLKVVDQWTGVTVEGRDHVSSSPNRVTGTAPRPGEQPLDDELHRDPALDPPLVPGPEWRRRLFGDNHQTDINQRGLDTERAAVMADARYRQQARKFLKVQIETLGLPRLRAGQHVEVRGMRPPFDGFYYVEQAVHTYGPSGLRTHLSARRPGAPFPPYGEAP